jgi:uncharacterized repeat protein (TIGR01451 family)
LEGKYEYHENVTVLKSGDVITYELIASNDGKSSVHNLAIVDKIPDGLIYLGHDTVDGVKVWVDKNTNTISWIIEELDVGQHISLKFKASVAEQKAQLIVNNAVYGTVENNNDAPAMDANDKKTNDVVHQVIEFHKMSEIVGGSDLGTATSVAVGDKILYTLKLIATEDLTNVCITDAIPSGLTFVPGSIAIKHNAWEAWKNVADENGYFKDTDDQESVLITNVDVAAGEFYVQFAVTVDHIPANTSALFVNQAVVTYDVVPNDPNELHKSDAIVSEVVTHMTETKIEGSKDGQKETYVGPYENKENVTIVSDGDEIVYTITISNTGASDLRNVVIRDKIPEHTVFNSVANDGVFNETGNCVEWIVDLKAGESITVKFTVICNSNGKAVEIRNIASYAAPEDPTNVKENEWLWTDEVVYQTVEFHKTSSIEHGVNIYDATHVAIGSQFTYILTFNNTNTVYNLNVQDMIPRGLSYVGGTAAYQLPNGQIILVDVTIDENNMLTFPTIDEVPAGFTTFYFDVLVEDVDEYDTEYFFVNQATAHVTASSTNDEAIDLISETVSNKTIKPKEPDPDGPPQTGDNIGNAFAWAGMSLMSATLMIAFGAYGLSDEKKKQ